MSDFKCIELLKKHDIAVVKLVDDKVTDAERIAELGEELMTLAKPDGRRVVINMDNVRFLSSSAINKLIVLERRLASNGGNLKLSNLRPEVEEVFNITQLHSVFDIRGDEEEALSAFWPMSPARLYPLFSNFSSRSFLSVHMQPFMTNTATWNYDEWIPSDTALGNKVVLLIVENMQRIGWPENDMFGVHMALEEAIINAIKHGNLRDPAKQVHVIVQATLQDFYLQVTDQGDGFDPDAVPDCTADENLELGSGRGLLLMRHYMDEVKYNETGNQLEIRKKRGPSDN